MAIEGLQIDIQGAGGDSMSLTITGYGKERYYTMIPTEKYIYRFKLKNGRVCTEDIKTEQSKE